MAAMSSAFLPGFTDRDGDGDIDSDDVDAWVAADSSHLLPASIDLNGDKQNRHRRSRLLEDFNGNGTVGTSDSDKQSILLIGFGQCSCSSTMATSILGDGGNEDGSDPF